MLEKQISCALTCNHISKWGDDIPNVFCDEETAHIQTQRVPASKDGCAREAHPSCKVCFFLSAQLMLCDNEYDKVTKHERLRIIL